MARLFLLLFLIGQISQAGSINQLALVGKVVPPSNPWVKFNPATETWTVELGDAASAIYNQKVGFIEYSSRSPSSDDGVENFAHVSTQVVYAKKTFSRNILKNKYQLIQISAP